MENLEIAEMFRTRVENFDKPVPLDYYDRFLDLALYLNETIPEGPNQVNPIYLVRDAMIEAYRRRDNTQVKEEVNDTNTGTS